jgi:hypothetical protein
VKDTQNSSLPTLEYEEVVQIKYILKQVDREARVEILGCRDVGLIL